MLSIQIPLGISSQPLVRTSVPYKESLRNGELGATLTTKGPKRGKDKLPFRDVSFVTRLGRHEVNCCVDCEGKTATGRLHMKVALLF